MGLFGGLKSGLQSAGRFKESTGKGALQALGQGVKEVRRIGGVVNSATGGAAGKVFEMSKSLPGIGAVSRNIEKGLNLADSASKKGLRAIDIGQRGVNAYKKRDVGAFKSAFGDARKLANR